MTKNIVYLNNSFVAEDNAKISIFDRGFLFADGVYEVIPVYSGKILFLDEHLHRLQKNINHLDIKYTVDHSKWLDICNQLINKNGQNRPIYIQITRGADTTRLHDYDKNLIPTITAFSLEPIELGNSLKPNDISVITMPDNRWKLCNIKSISLLGNILIRQQGLKQNAQEVLLINNEGNIVEGTSSNYFMVKNNTIFTPPLNNEILPGITRKAIFDICQQNEIELVEKHLTKDYLYKADEIWLTSSTKEIRPVTKIDNNSINNGTPGKVWQKISKLYIDYIKNILTIK